MKETVTYLVSSDTTATKLWFHDLFFKQQTWLSSFEAWSYLHFANNFCRQGDVDDGAGFGVESSWPPVEPRGVEPVQGIS